MNRAVKPAAATLAIAGLLGLTGCGSHPAATSPRPEPAAGSSSQPGAVTGSPSASRNSFLPYSIQTVAPGPSATSAAVRGSAPDPATVDRHDALAVGQAFVALAYTSDTALDTTPADAGRRAAALAGEPLAQDLRSARSAAAPGASWQNWVQHHAYTHVTTTENVDDGRPADSAAAIVRSWSATAAPIGDDGWAGPPQTITVYVSLTNNHPDGTGSWAVTDLRAAA